MESATLKVIIEQQEGTSYEIMGKELEEDERIITRTLREKWGWNV